VSCTLVSQAATLCTLRINISLAMLDISYYVRYLSLQCLKERKKGKDNPVVVSRLHMTIFDQSARVGNAKRAEAKPRHD
jgi:hypothetical protein